MKKKTFSEKNKNVFFKSLELFAIFIKYNCVHCTRVCVFNFLPFSIIQLQTMQYNDYIASCFPLELYQ